MTIGQKISELRKKENLTQEKLAEKLNVTRQTLSSWENDLTSPDLRQAKLLADIFGVSLDELVNNHVEIKVKQRRSSILNHLIGKTCFIDIEDEEDYRLTIDTKCLILEVYDQYLKIQFTYSKEIITKLLDIDLVLSIRYLEKENEVWNG